MRRQLRAAGCTDSVLAELPDPDHSPVTSRTPRRTWPATAPDDHQIRVHDAITLCGCRTRRQYPFAAARTRFAAASTFRRISHSQIRTTCQPASLAAWLFRRSRSRFVDSFCSHRAAFGPRNCAGECAGHPCQKHPSTNTATRYLGRTKSGVQRGLTGRCTLNLRPRACTALRRPSSGFVFRVRRPRRCSPSGVAVHVPAT